MRRCWRRRAQGPSSEWIRLPAFSTSRERARSLSTRHRFRARRGRGDTARERLGRCRAHGVRRDLRVRPRHSGGGVGENHHPHGRILLSAWLPGGAVGEDVRIAREIAMTALDAPAPFGWHDRDTLSGLLAPHGFSVGIERHAHVFTAASIEDFLQAELIDHPSVAPREPCSRLGGEPTCRPPSSTAPARSSPRPTRRLMDSPSRAPTSWAARSAREPMSGRALACCTRRPTTCRCWRASAGLREEEQCAVVAGSLLLCLLRP